MWLPILFWRIIVVDINEKKKKDDDKNDLKKYQKLHRIFNKKHPTAPLVTSGGVSNIYGRSINNAFFNKAMGDDVSADEFTPAPDGIGDAGVGDGVGGDAGSGDAGGASGGAVGESINNKSLTGDTNMIEKENSVPQKPLKEDAEDKLYFKAYITNLGKYNEGDLVGEWVEFPIDEDDFDAVLKRIGIGSTDEFGQPYEEWFVTDYDSNIDHGFGEYVSYESLNDFGETVDMINKDGIAKDFRNAMEVCDGSADDIMYAIVNGDIIFYDGISTDSDLGYALIEEIYGDEIPDSLIEDYFDFDMLGRDLDLEYSPEEGDPETAGEYFCGDPTATHSDIGYAYYDMVGADGIANKEYYFDYEAYGRDCRYDGFTFTSDGCIWDRR